MTRITTTGNDRPYIVATGYQNTPRDDGARFERPAGEPPLWVGVGVLVFVAIVAVFAAAVMP